MRPEAKIRMFENRFWLVCRLIAATMGHMGQIAGFAAGSWIVRHSPGPYKGWVDQPGSYSPNSSQGPVPLKDSERKTGLTFITRRFNLKQTPFVNQMDVTATQRLLIEFRSLGINGDLFLH